MSLLRGRSGRLDGWLMGADAVAVYLCCLPRDAAARDAPQEGSTL